VAVDPYYYGVILAQSDDWALVMLGLTRLAGLQTGVQGMATFGA